MDSDKLLVDVHELIRDVVAHSPLSFLPSVAGAIFDEPLIGVADGVDPLFAQYKRIIGDYYLTPIEAMQKTVEQRPGVVVPGEVSVICWVLPWAAPIREANAAKTSLPASPTWSKAQEQGERLNNVIRESVRCFFRDSGYVAAAPMHAPLYARFGRYLTNWSERHALYVAGMGTFGLSQWLITERGVAMRCGSVVVGAALPGSQRSYRSHTENCLFYSDGSCRKCADRCPAGAISVAGLDKAKCREYLDIHAKTEGCGLCQTNVPCEAQNPVPEAQTAQFWDGSSRTEIVNIGVESLDVIAPLWDKLRRYQQARSPHFPGHYAGRTWTARRAGLVRKATTGAIHIDVVRESASGIVVGYCVSTATAESEGILESVYLEPAYRREDVGDALMKRALDWMDLKQVSKRTLTVGVGNEEVLPFYARYGFHPKHVTVEQVATQDPDQPEHARLPGE